MSWTRAYSSSVSPCSRASSGVTAGSWESGWGVPAGGAFGVDIGQGGGDLIDGGSGSDTAEYQLASSDIVRDLRSDGSITVMTATGTDTLIDIERIAVDDGAYIFDLMGEDAGTVYRLYDLFERAPDEAGLRFWTDVAASTDNIDFVVDAFVSGPEYDSIYGGTDTTGYLELLYMNVLDREADQAGLDFWSSALDSGAVDRMDVALYFTDSAENIADHAPMTDDGFFVA